MRAAVMFLLIVVNYVLQSTVFSSLAILGTTPDTALILIVSYGIMRGDIEGALFGLACGLVHDVFGSHYIGLYAMLGFLTGYVCGKPFKDFFHDNYFLPFFVVVIATVCYQFLFYCTAILFTGSVDLMYYIGTRIIPKTIYTASLSIPLYSLLYFINGRIELYEYNRRSLFGEKKP
jgi:rod shape-determining protein MreD